MLDVRIDHGAQRVLLQVQQLRNHVRLRLINEGSDGGFKGTRVRSTRFKGTRVQRHERFKARGFKARGFKARRFKARRFKGTGVPRPAGFADVGLHSR